MWKISILSLLICVLLMVSYLFGGVRTDAHGLFNGLLGYFGLLFIVSTLWGARQLTKDKGEIQTKLSEVQ